MFISPNTRIARSTDSFDCSLKIIIIIIILIIIIIIIIIIIA